MSEGPKKTTILKTILPILVILVLVASALFGLSRLKGHKAGEGPHQAAAEGQTLPDIELTRLDGQKVRLSEIKGKVILINFWASWCSACMVEMPSIVSLWKKFKKDGFEVLAVNVDDNPASVVPGLAKRFAMEFPILVDPGNKLADVFDVHAIPTTVILDGNRKVLLIDSGERDWISPEVQDQMKRWLELK